MKRNPVSFSLPLLLALSLIIGVSLFSLLPESRSFEQRRADETALSVDMSNRLEDVIETIIGKDRCIVKVQVNLSQQPIPPEIRVAKGNLRKLPGVVTPEITGQTTRAASVTPFPVIEKISVTAYLDNKLPLDKVNLIKISIPRWIGLDTRRGDTLKIELIPWREIPPDDVSIKQLSFSKRNFWVIVGIATLVIMAFLIIVYLAMPARKFIRERMRAKQQDQKPSDLDSVLKELSANLSKTSQANANEILEDIKELLAKSPRRSDGLLEEIKDVLKKMSEAQAAMTGRGGAAAGAAAAAAPEGFTSNEFLAALKDAIAPAGAGGGAGGMSSEFLDVLQKIEDLSKRQVEALSGGAKAFDEPFKYLNSLSAKEIMYYIEGEPPRLASTILAHIDPVKSSQVLAMLPDEPRLEVSIAMAGSVETDSLAIEIKNFVQRKMPEVKLRADFTPVAGSKALADILSTSPPEFTKSVLEKMGHENPTLTAAVKNEMFLFEDVVRLDNKAISETLKTINQHQLAQALSVAPEVVRERFFENMTENAVVMLREEMEAARPPPTGSGKKITVFEDILDLDKMAIENMLKHLEKDIAKIALKGSSDDIKQRFYSLISDRAAEILKEDIDVMADVSLSKSEEARNKILATIHNLENEPLVAQRAIIKKMQELAKSGRIDIGKEKAS